MWVLVKNAVKVDSAESAPNRLSSRPTGQRPLLACRSDSFWRENSMQCKSRFLLWLLVTFTVVPLAGAQVYRITDLGTLPAGTFSAATGINTFGQVTGYADMVNSYSARVHHAFSWTNNGGMQDLGTLPNFVDDPGFASWANGVNDPGRVVGGSWHDQEGN